MSTRPQQPLSRETFLALAQQAGLDTTDAQHLDTLFPYVQAVLRSLEPLRGVDVAAAEPDMAFIPAPGGQA